MMASVAEVSNSRLVDIAQANINAVHAYQIMLARKSGRPGQDCYQSDLSNDQLQAIVNHQLSLLKSPPADVKAWAEGNKSSFDPAKDLQPMLSAKLAMCDCLPVNVVIDFYAKATGASRNSLLAAANVFQTIMEINRDGDLLQDLMDFYIAVGIPMYVGQFGITQGNEEYFLTVGKELAAKTGDSPFDTSLAAWQIAGQKTWNWARKKLGVRDHRVIAGELLQEDDIEVIVPKLKAIPAHKIAIVGHSYTMHINWSTPSSFTMITKAVFEKINPGVTFEHYTWGSMEPGQADEKYSRQVLEYKPSDVYFFLILTKQQDVEDMVKLTSKFLQAGIKCHAFTMRFNKPYSNVEWLQQVAKQVDLEILDIEAKLADHPERPTFMSLDGIHMREPYHRLAAKELLKVMAK